jgi:hypothetical protein
MPIKAVPSRDLIPHLAGARARWGRVDSSSSPTPVP